MWALVDTNVYIDHWERGLYAAVLDDVAGRWIIRLSSVVLSELRRGARSRSAERELQRLRKAAPVVWEPTSEDWWAAGRLIRVIGNANGWDRSKRRDFQNDALIALTARRYGAIVVTANVKEFALLAEVLGLSIVAV